MSIITKLDKELSPSFKWLGAAFVIGSIFSILKADVAQSLEANERQDKDLTEQKQMLVVVTNDLTHVRQAIDRIEKKLEK